MDCITIKVDADADFVWCATTSDGHSCYARGTDCTKFWFSGGKIITSSISVNGFTGANTGRLLTPLFSTVLEVRGPGQIVSAKSDPSIEMADSPTLVLLSTNASDTVISPGPDIMCWAPPTYMLSNIDKAVQEETQAIAERYAAALMATCDPSVYRVLTAMSDWRPSVPSMTCKGQPYAVPFFTTVPYLVAWATDSVSLLLQLALRPGSTGELFAVRGEPANALWETLYATMLTTMCGPYESEPADSRDSPLINLGLRDDCDGASQVGAHLHALFHQMPIIESLLARGCAGLDPEVFHLTLAILQWAKANTTPRSLCGLCYADPDRAANSSAASAPSDINMHMCILIERTAGTLFLVETTGYIATRSTFPHALVSRPRETDLGYNQIIPWDPRKYIAFVMLRDETCAYPCATTGAMFPGQPCVDTLRSYPGPGIALESSRFPDIVPRIDDPVYRALADNLFPTPALPVSALTTMRTSAWTTGLPGHMGNGQPLVQVGPYFWIIADHDPKTHTLRRPGTMPVSNQADSVGAPAAPPAPPAAPVQFDSKAEKQWDSAATTAKTSNVPLPEAPPRYDSLRDAFCSVIV